MPNIATLPETASTWLNAHLNEKYHVFLVPGDAGMRAYYRIKTENSEYILMHDHDETQFKQYIETANKLAQYNIYIPTIHAQHIPYGLLLQEDLGSTMLSDKLTIDSVRPLYESCIKTLLELQRIPNDAFPLYSYDILQKEALLPLEWFFSTHCQL